MEMMNNNIYVIKFVDMESPIIVLGYDIVILSKPINY